MFIPRPASLMKIHIYPPDGAPFEISQEELISLWNSGLIEDGCEYRIEGMKATRPLEEFFLHLPPSPPAPQEQAPAPQVSSAPPERPGIAMRRAARAHKRNQQWTLVVGAIVLLGVGAAITIPMWMKHGKQQAQEKLRKLEASESQRIAQERAAFREELDQSVAIHTSMLPRKLEYGIEVEAVRWITWEDKPLMVFRCKLPVAVEDAEFPTAAATAYLLEDHYRSHPQLLGLVATCQKLGVSATCIVLNPNGESVSARLELPLGQWTPYAASTDPAAERGKMLRRTLRWIIEREQARGTQLTVELLPGNVISRSDGRLENTREESVHDLYERMAEDLKQLAGDPLAPFFVTHGITHRFRFPTPRRRSQEFTYEFTPERIATEAASLAAGNPLSAIPWLLAPTGSTMSVEELKAKLTWDKLYTGPTGVARITNLDMKDGHFIAHLKLRSGWRDKMNIPAYDAACTAAMRDFYASEPMEPYRRLGVLVSCIIYDQENRLITMIPGKPSGDRVSWEQMMPFSQNGQIGLKIYAERGINDDNLSDLAETERKNVPRYLHPGAEVRWVSALPDRRYRLECVLKEFSKNRPAPAEHLSGLKASLQELYRESEEMEPFRKAGVTVIFDYFDKDGTSVLSLSLSPGDSELKRKPGDGVSKEKPTPSAIDEALRLHAAEISAALPMDLNDVFRMDSMRAIGGGVLEFNGTFTMLAPGGLVNPAEGRMILKLAMESSGMWEGRTLPPIALEQTSNVVIRIAIKDKEGNPFFNYDVKPGEIMSRTPAQKDSRIDDILSQHATEFIPEKTGTLRITSLKHFSGKILEYTYTLSPELESATADPGKLKTIKSKLKAQYDGDALAYYRKHGISFRYRLHDRKGREIAVVSAGPAAD